MTVTITGMLMHRDGEAGYWDRDGNFQAPTWVVNELTVGADVIPVDRFHDHRFIGQVVRLERIADRGVQACLVVHDDDLVDTEQRWYLSPGGLNSQPEDGSGACWVGRHPVLHSVALVEHPAQTAVRAVSIRHGDVRSLVDRGGWPYTWDLDPLLRRTAEQPRRNDRTLRIIDIDRDGNPALPTARRSSHPSAGIRHYHH